MGSYASLSVCLSVRHWTKIQTYCMVHLQAVTSHLPVKPMTVYGTGRWAHINVKMHFLSPPVLILTRCVLMHRFMFVCLPALTEVLVTYYNHMSAPCAPRPCLVHHQDALCTIMQLYASRLKVTLGRVWQGFQTKAGGLTSTSSCLIMIFC